MLSFLERVLRGGPVGPPPGRKERHQLAAAALLVEAARVDGHFGAEERQAVERLLSQHLGLGEARVRELMAEAEAAADEAADWQGFTRVLNDSYEQDERLELVEMLWEVIERDGHVDTLEASLMRRVPALMYVSDRDNAQARRRVRERLGRAG
jgi:uncharacterized tellurite resistance protein B-like protein